MYNVKILKDAMGLCHITVFNNHVVTHDAPKKKVVNDIKTPFIDERENSDSFYYYGHLLLSDEEIEYRKQESLRCSMSRTRSSIRRICLSFVPMYFCTFTFSPDIVDRYSYSDCFKLMQKFLQKLRDTVPSLDFCVVPELHKDGAVHFHGLFSKELPVHHAGYFRNKKTGVREHVYHIDNWPSFNSATIVKDSAKVVSYIIKYITKDLTFISKGKHRYLSSNPVIKEYKFFALKENLNKIINFIGGCYPDVKPYTSQVKFINFTQAVFETVYLSRIVGFCSCREYSYGTEQCRC